MDSCQQLATATAALPSFSGSPSEDVAEWISLFNLFASSKNLNGPALRLTLLCSLQGEAKNFFYFINGEELPMETIFELLKNRFEGDNLSKNLKDLKSFSKLPTESWAGFIERYIVLARKCGVPESLQVDWITDHIPLVINTILATFKIANTKITADAIVGILRSETAKKLGLDDDKLQVSVISKKKKKKRRNLVCSFHGKCAHTTDKCEVLNKSRSPYVSSSFISLNSSGNRFMAKIVFDSDYTIHALLDTGADVSCIRSSVLKNLNIPLTKKLKVITANNEEAFGYLTALINFNTFDTEFSANFVALDNLAFEAILGLDVISTLITTVGASKVFPSPPIPSAQIVNCSILSDFENVMADEIFSSTPSCLAAFHINTGDSPPIARPRYRLGKPQEDAIESQVEKLLKAGIVRKSFSPWSSPALIVPKKDGSDRLCIDYTEINKVTIKDSYPLPRIDDILDTLSGACIYSTLDATSGYYQIPVAEEDIPKTAFQTRSGLYEFTRMPFGLSNAPPAFQRAMDEIFAEEKGKFLQVYLDDIIIFSKSKKEHETHLSQVLCKIKKAGLVLKKKKCHFFRDELTILGYRVCKDEIKPTPERIQAIHDFPVPVTIKDLRSFLGLLSYCRNFAPNLSEKAAPLSNLLRGSPTPPASSKLELSPDQVSTFMELKEILNDHSKLKIPNYENPFIVTTDASTHGISGILAQKVRDGSEAPVSFFSRTLTEAQSKYSATQLELLAVVETLKHFRPYLLHKKFTLRTDHQALLALKHSKNLNSMLFRWSLLLADYDFEVEYIKGESNPADVLSRTEPKLVSAILTPNKALVLEKEVQKKLIAVYHLLLGHGSPGNVIYNLSKKYEWKGMYSQVHDFVKHCQTCLKAGNVTPNNNFHMLVSSKPGELVALDTIGPLPCSQAGNKFIITAIDHFSKLSFALAVPNKSSHFVSFFIKDIVAPKLGSIENFLSDNGLEFKSSLTLNTASSLGASWKFGSPYHPETQGVVERFNGTIMKKIAKLSKFNLVLWDNYVSPAVEAYNNSFHRAIGCSPNELFFGKVPIFDVDKSLISGSFNQDIPLARLSSLRELIREKYAREFKGSASASPNLKIGDSVLKFNFSPLLTKLDPHWEAGFKVSKVKHNAEAFTLVKNGVEFEANKAHVKLDSSVVPSQGGE